MPQLYLYHFISQKDLMLKGFIVGNLIKVGSGINSLIILQACFFLYISSQ